MFDNGGVLIVLLVTTWAPPWAPPGHRLGSTWAPPGHRLGTAWAPPGHQLGTTWEPPRGNNIKNSIENINNDINDTQAHTD